MTIPVPADKAQRLRAPGYLILGIAIILPLIDLVMSVVPVRLGMVAWRFGSVGLFASAIGAPLLVLMLVYALALMAGDRRVVIVCGVVAALLTVLLVVSAGSFTLDTLQMKAKVPQAALSRFYVASAQALIKLGLQGVAAVVLAVSALRATKDPALAARKPVRSAAANLIVGRSGHRPIDRGDHAHSLEAGVPGHSASATELGPGQADG